MWVRICELKHELSDKEQALSKAYREKEELSYEKKDLETRLQTHKNHRHICTCACVSGLPISNGDVNTKVFNGFANKTNILYLFQSRFVQTMLERLERERDIARADVERLIEERDALRERLKVKRSYK